ncbi:nitroreductase family protein [Glaciibacter superstes]|uniref:nitroreductase family protein n=1 Tax=Glaciibacter superstes TaxID=501023 RepID=UPI0003B664A5|nr:nitroreductase family protein [Glaciibacter superstes]
MSAVSDAIDARRSYSRVTAETPDRAELLRLVSVAGRVADHGSLRPWRLIELRGDARRRLGDALAEASGRLGDDAARLAAKALRAELLIAIVASRKESHKVYDWEQDAAAAGVAHALSLLLFDAGWGVMWRTGPFTRSEPVRRMHQLAPHEELLGWLYVGGVPSESKSSQKAPLDPAEFLSAL